MATPAIFLVTGWPPLLNASVVEIFALQLPAVAAAMIFMHFLAPREFSPIASTVESVLQSFRLMPVVLLTLVKPKGHSFKVTPKGSDAGLASEDRFTIKVALGIIFLTSSGLIINANYATRIVTAGELLPVVAFWSVFNMIVLLIVATIAVPRPIFRSEERFEIAEPCRILTATGDASGETTNISLTGILVVQDQFIDTPAISAGDWVGVELAEIGIVPCFVRRAFQNAGQENLGMSFHLPVGQTRDRMIQKLFAAGRETMSPDDNGPGTFLTMLSRVFGKSPPVIQQVALPDPGLPPDWLIARAAKPLEPDGANAKVGSRKASRSA